MVASMNETATSPRSVHKGPPPGLLAAVHVGLFLASLVVLNGATDGSAPLPGADPRDIVGFYDANPGQLRLAGMLQFGAAVPLALFAAATSSLVRHLGVRAAGTTIALVGGTVAAVLLGLTGMLTATAGATAGALDGATAAVVHRLTFFVGGAAYIAFFGLLLAGIAVTSLFADLLPRWLCWAALAVFAVAELATLSLAVEPLTFAIPIGRFAGMAALVAVGVQLPARRLDRQMTA